MHIPSGTTAAVALELFTPALEAALQPSGDYDVERWLYVPNTYSEYRYILGTRGKKPLICIGINPSTAAPDALDPTLQSVERIAQANGYDSFLMFNVYAQSESPAVWAAWGNIIEKRDYLPGCVQELVTLGQQVGAQWFTAGPLLKSGHPHHPLYLRRDTPLLPFDADTYLQAQQARMAMKGGSSRRGRRPKTQE